METGFRLINGVHTVERLETDSNYLVTLIGVIIWHRKFLMAVIPIICDIIVRSVDFEGDLLPSPNTRKLSSYVRLQVR